MRLPCSLRYLTIAPGTGDRALSSDHTILATDYRFARSGRDPRVTLRRAARADDTNSAFARRERAFSDISRPAARRATRTAKRRRRSSSGYTCIDDRSARTADHDVRTDHFSLGDGNDAHSFTKRAAATARRAEFDANRTIAFCSKSIPIGHRGGRARRSPFITRRLNTVARVGDVSCDHDKMLFRQRCSASDALPKKRGAAHEHRRPDRRTPTAREWTPIYGKEPGPKRHQVPNGAKFQTSQRPYGAFPHLAHNGASRSLGLRAVWDFAWRPPRSSRLPNERAPSASKKV